jgi:predicted esterase
MRSITLAVLFLCAAPAIADPDRYELGRRMHDFEVAWDKHAEDAAAKKRAAPLLNQAMQQCIQRDHAAVARTIDTARHALDSADPAPPAVRWADALQIVPESRVVDASVADLTVTVKTYYKPEVEAPQGARLRARIGNGKVIEAALESLPATVKVPIKDAPGSPSADFKLTAEITADGKVLATKVVGVARVEKLSDRVAAVKKAAQSVPSPPPTIEQASFVLLASLLDDLTQAKVLETDYPSSRLVFGGERLAKVTEPYYIRSRPGEFWLSIPTEKGPTTIRIRIPPKLEEKKQAVPIVFALHGMGASENAFFEGYGNGIVPRLATERGWLVVSPRVEGPREAGPAPNVPAILDELSKRYPIDPKRVFLVGHSMGAVHALELAEKDPGRYAAIAIVGGGKAVRKPEALKGVSFFVGCGKLDPGLDGVKALHKAFDDAKLPVTYKEYDDIEHIMIVREAANDVFKYFDK